MKCPRCGDEIPASRIEKGLVYCGCGWEPLKEKTSFQPQRDKRRLVISMVAVAAIVLSFFVYYAKWAPFAFQAAPLLVKKTFSMANETELHELGAICNTLGKNECSLNVYRSLVEKNSSDEVSLGNLAVIQAKMGLYQEAVRSFETLFSTGVATGDAYYWYARSLFELSRKEEAISAGYKALNIAPELIDAIESQIKYLISVQREEEALGLVQSMNVRWPSYQKYWTGKLTAVGDLVKKKTGEKNSTQMRFSTLSSHFIIPIRFNDEPEFHSFMYDTGATFVVLNGDLARKLGYDRLKGESVQALIADGSRVNATKVVIPKLWVGAAEVQNVPAVYCDGCALLMGQSLNSRFEATTQKKAEVSFLNLKPL